MAAGRQWVVAGAWKKQGDQLSVQRVGGGRGLEEGAVTQIEVLCLVQSVTYTGT